MDVFDLRYMKRIRLTLRTVGAWPNHVFEDAPVTKLSVLYRYGYTCLLCVMCSLTIVGQGMYVYKNVGIIEFIDLGQTCLTFLMSCVFVQRTLLPIQSSYQAEVEEFATKFHLLHHKDKTDYAANMYNKVTKLCRIATVVQHIQIFLISCMYNLAPLYSNYKSGMFSSEKPINGTYEHSVAYVLPFNHHTVFWYTITCIWNFYVSYNLACIFYCHDLLIYVIVFHIWGHLKIFQHNLMYFVRPSVNVNSKSVPFKYSAEESDNVTRGLKESIVHYITIKEFVANTSDTYSFTLCVYYAYHLLTDCILLLECSALNIDAMAKYGFLTVGMIQQLIQISVVFELISSEGDSLADAVYSLPWECMDVRNRRTVLILLHIAQQSLALKACGMVPVGVQTMVAILKASFSYFIMLKTFTNN